MRPDEIAFARYCHEELSRVKSRDGIGLLAEKRLHSVLKRWVLDDFSCHEIRILEKDGTKSRFVADVLTPDGQIFEIQTGSLFPLCRKLAFYLEKTEHPVTVVHPMIGQKQINWIDPETGEICARSHSTKKQTPLSALGELKPLIPFLTHPRFSLCLPFLCLEEFRIRDGWGNGGRRGSHRFELIPTALQKVHMLEKREDYLALYPKDLPPSFTAKIFSTHTRLRGYALYDALAVFEALGACRKCGKQGRSTLYESLPFE